MSHYTLIAYRPTGSDTYGSWSWSEQFITVVSDEHELIEQIVEWEVQDFLDDELATFEYTIIRPNGFVDDIGQWKHAIKIVADERINKIKDHRADRKLQEEQEKEEKRVQADLALLAKLQSQYGDNK